jgi:hypothetical protein
MVNRRDFRSYLNPKEVGGVKRKLASSRFRGCSLVVMNRLNASLAHVIVALAVFGAACSDSKPKEAPAAAGVSQQPAASPEGAGVTATSFGVPECDTYVTKYLACLEGKVPADQRDKLAEAFEANRTKWRAMSTTREGAMALSVTCKAATEKAKEALSVDYGCEF